MKISRPGEGLAQAFRSTTYRVACDGDNFDLRVGCKHPALDATLRAKGVMRWAIVTACNPGATRRTAAENAVALARLTRRAERFGWVHFPASNHADISADPKPWPVEYGVFLCDVTREEARALAIEFGQLASVVGERDEVAELMWTADQRLG